MDGSQTEASEPGEGGGGGRSESPLDAGRRLAQGTASPRKGGKPSPKKGKKGEKTPGKPKRKPRKQGNRAQAKGKEAESGQLLCASYNADRLTKAS